MSKTPFTAVTFIKGFYDLKAGLHHGHEHYMRNSPAGIKDFKYSDPLILCTGPGTRVAFSHGVSIKEHRFANAVLRLIGEPWLSSCTSAKLPGYIGPGWSVITTQGAGSRRNLEAFAVVEKL